MPVYKHFTAEQLEGDYNLRARRPDYEVTVVPDWQQRSVEMRERGPARIDLAYGDGDREKLDFFCAPGSSNPALVYIHGGYWQRGDKSVYSFLAEPFVRHGVSLAVINYNLCPSVRISQITPQVRMAVAWLWRNAAELGVSRQDISVMGHSAGGHLTGMMMATDWTRHGDDLPLDVVKSGIPVSALFELEPLRFTSINDGPQMDAEEAQAESPMFMEPVTDAAQLVVVGGAETPEFHRQSDEYCERYRTDARAMERYSVPDADHFDELNRLSEDDSAFFQKTAALATA